MQLHCLAAPLCVVAVQVDINELNMLSSNWDHAVKTQKVDLGSPAGTLSFRVNSGVNGDTYQSLDGVVSAWEVSTLI